MKQSGATREQIRERLRAAGLLALLDQKNLQRGEVSGRAKPGSFAPARFLGGFLVPGLIITLAAAAAVAIEYL